MSRLNFTKNFYSISVPFADADIWYSEEMMSIDFPSYFKDVAPFILYDDRNALLDVAGKDGLNPVLLLTIGVYYKNESHPNFKANIEDISARLLNAYFTSKNRTVDQKNKENDGEHAIALFANRDTKQISELISIYKVLKKEAAKHPKSSDEDFDDDVEEEFEDIGLRRITRGDGSEAMLLFPFQPNECWMLSATHHSNQQCYAESCPKNAIDMAPNLYMGFGHDFSYFNSEGTVTASHSGMIHVHSPCSLEVKSRHYTTFYSHISISRKTGDLVIAGQKLGRIQLDPYASNCNCEIAIGDTECSTGPHLHWELRNKNNQPIDIDGLTISNFKIKTGTTSYDVGCRPENCRNNMTKTEIESTCSTVFIRKEDNMTFCPSSQGANWGKLQINHSQNNFQVHNMLNSSKLI